MNKQSEIETLFRQHYAAMYKLAVMLLHDSDAARDIVHDVFEALLKSGITDIGPGYLLNAVRNRCNNGLRQLSVHDRIRILIMLENDETDTDDWPDELTLTNIRESVEKTLTEPSRNIVKMRFYQNLTCKEIADSMNISKTAVYKHLHNAIITIRKHLSANG